MVANMSDDDIWRLNRGGHDPHKVYAAYAAAVKHKGQPTVILAKTVKGYGMGAVGEGKNIAHQQKKMPIEALKQFRDRFNIPIADDKLADLPVLQARRRLAGDEVPAGAARAARRLAPAAPAQERQLEVPKLEAFKALLEATGEGREISTTMAFVRMLTALVQDKGIGKHVVPIVPDESRTFGMEGLFRQLGIYSPVGQLYEPEDSDQLMFYQEDKNGQILQEGINEAGAMCSWIAAATSYANSNVPMIPFYIFYSMFGMQRVGDLAWAAGDMRARGFLMGGTAGRTTLNGEGLQHEDGHSHILASDDPELRLLRPDLRLRGRGDRAGRPAPHGGGAGGRLLLHHRDERELPAPGPARGRARGNPQGDVPVLATAATAQGAARAAARLRHDPARSDGRGRAAARRTGASAPTSGAARASTSCAATASPWRAGTCCIRPRSRASRTSSNASRPRRAGDRRDRLHARLRRPDPRVRAAPLQGARHRRLRPQRFAREPAPLLRGGPRTMSRSRR